MRVDQLVQALGCRIIVKSPGFPDLEIVDAVASDLMSDVLVCEGDNFIIVTSLTSEQVIRTADIVGAPVILLVNGKEPQPSMKKLAEDQGIGILSTPRSCFRACVEIGRILDGSGSR